jgi:Pyruvate/2-oxoacid:ferredoxin oxidoreductase gamma subunit
MTKPPTYWDRWRGNPTISATSVSNKRVIRALGSNPSFVSCASNQLAERHFGAREDSLVPVATGEDTGG